MGPARVRCGPDRDLSSRMQRPLMGWSGRVPAPLARKLWGFEPHRNMLVIALANKLARLAWAVLARGHAYQARGTSHAV